MERSNLIQRRKVLTIFTALTLSIGIFSPAQSASAVSAPSFVSISPSTGSTAESTTVTITGTNFLDTLTVTIDGVAATNVVRVSATSITALFPPRTAGSKNIIITNSDSGTVTATGAFTFLTPPTFTSISPVVGVLAGGTAITITGTNFLASPTVTIGGVAATSVVWASATSITAITPAGTGGLKNIVITNTDSGTVTSASAFRYVVNPIFTAISPARGTTAGGTAVTITGENFLDTPTVTIGGVAATSIVRVSATSITALSPAGTAGSKNVVITNSDSGTVTAIAAFTHVTPPTFTSVLPTSGGIAGGTAITITGTNFLASPTVTIGGVVATSVVWVSATSITALTPAGTVGSKNLVITNTDSGVITTAGAFTYTTSPTFTSISPTRGTTAGSTAVTITGSNFLAGVTVTIGGTAATSVVRVSATTITALSPIGTAGSKNIVISNPDLGTVTAVGAYTYLALPTFTTVAPIRGTIAGGTAITITGTNFLASPTVTIDGVAATSVVRVSATSITAIAPSGTVGSKNIVITNSDLGAVTTVGAFTYIIPPTFTSISPSNGETGTGTSVTITGDNFLAGVTVTIGGVAATSVIRQSPTSLTAVTPVGTAGLKSVVITNTDAGSVTTANAFNYGPPTIINIAAIAGLTPPASGATPVTTITSTAQYTGTVTWSRSTTTFGPGIADTATITLTPLTGYTLTGIALNFFTVESSTATTNTASTGVITSSFAATSSLTISYDSQGGGAIASGLTFIGGSIGSSPGTPSRSGFTFNGWFAASSGGSAIIFPYLHSQVINLTLFAQWSAVVVVSSGGGASTPTPIVVVVTEPVSLEVSIPEPVITVKPPVVISPDKPLVAPVPIAAPLTLTVGIVNSDNVVVPITIDIPVGVSDVEATIRVTPVLLTGENPLGLVTIQIKILDASGALVPKINGAIVIRFNNVAGGTTVASSQDGLIWRPIPLIPNGGTTLTAGTLDGYYLEANGKVVVVTSHLTYFGFKLPQSAKLAVVANSKIFIKGNVTRLTITGGSGTGSIQYQSLTATLCTISSDGLVTLKTAGMCKVEGNKVGDSTHLHQVIAYQMEIVNYSLSAIGSGVSKQMALNLGASYAKKSVILQYALKGSTRYRILSGGVLSSKGEFVSRKNLPNGSKLRALVSGKVVASLVVTGKK